MSFISEINSNALNGSSGWGRISLAGRYLSFKSASGGQGYTKTSLLEKEGKKKTNFVFFTMVHNY